MSRVAPDNAAHYEAVGSQGEHKDHVAPQGFEAKSKEIAGSIGGFFKKGFGMVKNSTSAAVDKISTAGIKESLGKAGNAVKGGFITAVDKSKELGGKIADSTKELGGKMKDGAISGFVRPVYKRKRRPRPPRRGTKPPRIS